MNKKKSKNEEQRGKKEQYPRQQDTGLGGGRKSDSNSQRRLLSRRSVSAYFVIGSLLLTTPLIVVFVWSPQTCSTQENIGIACAAPEIYYRTLSFLPFLMIAGGTLIAFNMKRVADSFRPRDEEEPGDRDDRDVEA